jgi:hypothetical protein
MITPATSTNIGGVQLTGVLGGGTATDPAPPSGYISAAMLAEAYALASALTAEIARAEAEETTLMIGYQNAVQSEITARTSAISSESTTRAAADSALRSSISSIQSSLATEQTSIASLQSMSTSQETSIVSLQGYYSTVTTALNSETTAREAAISAEQVTRIGAINSLLASVNTLIAELNAEITRAELAEESRLLKAANLEDLPSPITARANLGLGSIATHATSDFDAYGTATGVQANLTSEISRAQGAEGQRLAKSANLNDLTNVPAARANLGLGSAATQSSAAFDAAGTAAAEATRAESVEATKANDSAVVHISGTETLTGNKNFAGTLSQGGQAVVVTSDSRLTNTRSPAAASVTDSSIASPGLSNASISPTAAIAHTKLDTTAQTALGAAQTAVQTINGITGPAVTLNAANVQAMSLNLIQNQGDLIVGGSAGEPVTLPVALPNGYVLTVDSTASHGLSYKPTAPMVTSGTATLVAGSVTIANTAITTSSIIRTFSISKGGTVGALSVVLTAATSFQIVSTSATDTSKVYYEVVSY